MSYRIEFDWRAFHIPKELVGHHWDVYIACSLGGDNNVIRTEDDKVARSWSAEAYGDRYSVMEQVVEVAASCEGGNLKPRGRDTLPESYIAARRKKLLNAVPLADAAAAGFFFTAKLYVDSVNLPSFRRDTYDKLAAAVLCQKETPWWRKGTELEVFTFPLRPDKPGMLRLFQECHSLVELNFRNKISVSGPDQY